jgi:DNA-binding LacI/PurR family transcriptional regulator
MATIQEIAKRAGVSVATVSRVLNHYKYVAEDKRAAVQAIIAELDYTPNRHAIDLIRKETRTIGVMIPYNNNPAYDQVLHGVLNASIQAGYSVTVLPTKYNKERELGYLAMLKNKQLDGIILVSRANAWEELLPYAAHGSLISCEYTEHPGIGCSYVDRYASYLEAFELLQAHGHDRIAFTTARRESLSTQQTIAAYRAVYGEQAEMLHVPECYNFADGQAAGEKLLQGPARPTAVYANGDEVAGGIYHYAASRSLRVPQDLALIGQENQSIGTVLGLTTVDHQMTQVGEQAFALLLDKSKEKRAVPYRLIHRQSV